ncbi:MAG: hypothetical protein RR817_10350 [Niameybacter sp.]
MGTKRKIKVYNYSGHGVSHKPADSLAFIRWNILPHMSECVIEMDEEKLISEIETNIGFRRMFDAATLVIKDKAIREKYNMEELDEYVLDKNQVEEVVFEGAIERLEDVLQYAPDTVLDTVVEVCMKRELKDRSKLKMIKEYTGKDIESYYVDMEKEKQGSPIEEEKVSATGKKARQKKA